MIGNNFIYEYVI